MEIERIEKITEKGSKKINEDEYLIKDNLFSVFDGATSLCGFKTKTGKTGGKIASETAKNIFSGNNNSLLDLAKKVNNKINQKMINHNVDISKKENRWCVCVAAIRLHENNLEYLRIGDTSIFIEYKDGKRKLIKGKDIDIESLKLCNRLSIKRVKNIRERIIPQLLKVRRKQNIKYGVLNGEKKAMNFIKTGKLPLKNIKFILLFTDGLMLPRKNPELKHNWKDFIYLLKSKGLKGLLKEIRKIEDLDPYCWKYPRLKQKDDATGILIKFK